MCGLAGYYGPPIEPNLGTQVLVAMGDQLINRGPDGSGIWIDASSGIGLVHRRLAVQDLSQQGHQPMRSATGRYVISYNGEIYNFRTLREELANRASAFRGYSDTEVLLSAIEAWGVEGALKRCVGMFAFALWDQQKKTIILARDRMGEKPLYYGWQGKSFLFGSELKALRQHPNFERKINRDAVCLLLRHNMIGSPYSIYAGIKKLPPGSYLELVEGEREPQVLSYWSLHNVAEAGMNAQFNKGYEAAISELESRLSRSIEEQMVADVPLGAFLSGGIDSSTIVALMKKIADKPVKTFSIGFSEQSYDEAKNAKKVAKHLGTEHTELYVQARDALNLIPKLPEFYDEPFADSSQIPTYLLSALARQEVTVALSGDGGDELFGGYNRHYWVKRIWDRLSPFPQPLRKVLAQILGSVPATAWEQMVNYFPIPENSSFSIAQPGEKIHKLAGLLGARNVEAIYQGLTSHWQDPAKVVLHATEPKIGLRYLENWPIMGEIEHQMMFFDGVTYLPDDILTKVDRASMSVSLELRAPMLDHRVVEFAWSLPLEMKIREGRGKWILRQLLDKYVPESLIDRPKMGFAVPIDSWLRGPLKDWGESLLDEARLKQEGFFDPAPIRKKWEQHQSGKQNWQHHLWDILMFQSWLENEPR